ncbi:SLC25A27 [Cordylochernes scorpioides]|uniref:SLC25A27 n=1 Tax=Cordylochernes scorpioides TaxID=51811 RepID=A0ABY6LMY5_9ARAC|nr:SLC25A27 [Cordylochernes scorpioides]
MCQVSVCPVKDEGKLRLWQGVTPAIYRHLVYTGCRITFYEFFRDRILKKNSDGTLPLWKAVVGGSAAGGLAQFIASPMDLVKVQMQMEGRQRLAGLPPRVHNTRQAFAKILKEGGVRGLWKGWVPNVQRAALVNLGDLATYDSIKHQLLKHTSLKDDYLTHMLSSGCAGLVAATLGTPADVIKTRVMNQPTDSRGRGLLYTSSIDCLLKTIRTEGFPALYKGFVPIWARMVSLADLNMFCNYEKCISLSCN